MKKLLAALAVVAGLGFVMSCSDEVSDYTIGAPECGTEYTNNGKVTGKYTKTWYEVRNSEPVEPDVETGKGVVDSSFEKVTVGSGSYWYRKITFETEFEGDGASVQWSDIDKKYSEKTNASYYTSQQDEKTVYTVNFGGVKLSNYKYTVKGLESGRDYDQSWNPVNKSDLGVLTAQDAKREWPGSSYTFNKVSDASIYYNVDTVSGSAAVNVVANFGENTNLESDEFTVTNLLLSEAAYTIFPSYKNKDGEWQYGDLPEIETDVKGTETITFTFTATK